MWITGSPAGAVISGGSEGRERAWRLAAANGGGGTRRQLDLSLSTPLGGWNAQSQQQLWASSQQSPQQQQRLPPATLVVFEHSPASVSGKRNT